MTFLKVGWPVLIFALVFPSAMAYLYFDLLSEEGQGSAAVQITYAVSKVVQFGLPLLVVALSQPDPNAPPPRRKSSLAVRLRWLMFSLTFGGVVAIAIFFVGTNLAATTFTDTPAKIRSKVNEFNMGTPARFIVFAVFLCVVHSFLEEYYWRWFVHRGLRGRLPFVPAALISGLGFMGHHVFVLKEYFPGRFWTAALPFSLCIAVGGIVWAWLFERSRTLVGPWLSHLLVDTGIMIVGYRLMFAG